MTVPTVVGACSAPVVVAVPEKGPWLVAPVTSELLRGGAEPGVVGMALIWESGPKDVASAPVGWLALMGKSASEYPGTCGAGAATASADSSVEA
jgi:hypothetical protein